MRRLGASICAAALGSCIVVQDARAQATAPLPGSRPAPSVANQTAPVTRLNPTNRTLEIYVPFVESGRRLGDILIRLTPDDQLSVLESRLVEILGPALTPSQIAALGAGRAPDNFITADQAAAAGLVLNFNPQRMELQAALSGPDQSLRRIAIADLDRTIQGQFIEPAPFSAYLNVRGAVDYQHRGGTTGLNDPIFDLEFASRVGRFVLEAYGGLDLRDDAGFVRRSTTLVYDLPEWRVRSRFGDVQTPALSFQDAPALLGVSVERLYRAFEPQRNIRPRSFDAFQLNRESEVDIVINGQVARRVVLPAGNYQLDQFPFVGGSNDVQIIATDPTGRQEIARFSRFFDPLLLAPGLDEFGAAAGLRADVGLDGARYDSDDWFASGFYRRGISDNLTAGANLQGDRDLVVAGAEVIWSTPLGVWGGDFALSHSDMGTGRAARINYQLLNNLGGRFQGLNAVYETRSTAFGRRYGPDPDGAPISDGVSWTVATSASFLVTQENIASLNASYSRGRGVTPDYYDIGTAFAFRWGDLPQFTVSASYRHSDRPEERGFGVLFGFTTRFGARSFASGEYDTREQRGSVAFNQASLHETNSYNLNARLDFAGDGVGGSAVANVVGNRGEAGVSHSTFLNESGEIVGSRSGLRGALSLAATGDSVAFGRPIHDSFAIVRGHRTLDGADVWVDRAGERYAVRSGRLGPALINDLTSYNPRNIRADAPAGPPGYDYGTGSFRVLPPYRAGYTVTVGSDYAVTVMGVLTDAGEPLVLTSGSARSLDDPDAPVVAIFTNRTGRFSAGGLKPGRWRLIMAGPIPLHYDIVVPTGTVGLHQAGVLEANP